MEVDPIDQIEIQAIWQANIDHSISKTLNLKPGTTFEEYSDLLEEAGVDTVVELAQRVPQNLHKKMIEVNHLKHLVRRLPNEKQVGKWVAQAKVLPRVVTY